MQMLITRFISLPPHLKIAAGVMGGTSLLGILYLLAPGHFWIIFIGLIIVGLFLSGYAYFLKWQRQRKAAPMQDGLLNNSGMTPQGLSGAASMARLDDMNKKFGEGLERFRSAGKNIYSLPWYVLVGEPGSGKTEAVRNCNVGFPPGLQDQLQGTGGTLNMNWWFTNHAVILDTAGRLMFEEVQAGETNEWEQFLKLLRANRPDCPVNGMLLTISAESLIKDNADDLARKGGKIAQQLDNIQRALGVRFPVFILITKCDLINGFREFFDDITDPELQHQILGWSNPEELDEPFDPSQVEQHLEVVKKRMLRRRMRLLLDPVNTEDPQARRTNQVDALFAFPEALLGLAPRLRRYLEMIFVAGEWSAKPLFLRGIYFTSAMREGTALDSDLAEILGVSMDSLPEGRIFERDRAYFLRELFMKKVFVEKGLVTRANNTKQLQRQRKGLLLGCGLGGLALFFLLTALGATQLKRSIGNQLAFWSATQEKFATSTGNPFRIVDQAFPGSPYEYNGTASLKLGDASTTLAQLPVQMQLRVEKKISIPLIFKPLQLLGGIATEGFNSQRRKAMLAVFETTYLQPALEATRSKILDSPQGAWSADATDALVQLSRALVVSTSEPTLLGSGLRGDRPKDFNPDHLFRYVLSTGGSPGLYKQYKEDDDSIQTVMRWIYTNGGGDQEWPPAIFAHDPQVAQAAIERGIAEFTTHWSHFLNHSEENLLSALVSLKDAMKSFKKGEKLIYDIADEFEVSAGGWQQSILTEQWAKGIELIFKSKSRIDEAREILGAQLAPPYDDLIKKAKDQVLSEGALPAYERVLAALSDENRKEVDDETRTFLAAARSKLTGDRETLERNAKKQANELEEELPRLARLLLAKTPRGDSRLYQIRFDMYEFADRVYTKGVDAVQRLASDYKVFPLCRTSQLDQTMSIEKATEALRLVSVVQGTDDSDAANRAVAAIRQGGGLDFYKEVKEQFDRVVGTGRRLAVGANEDWFQRLKAVSEVLAMSPPLECEVLILPFTDQRDRPKIPGEDLRDTPLTPHRYLELRDGDELLARRMQTDRPWTDTPPSVTIPGKDLSFQFFHHHDDEHPHAKAWTDAPWTILKAIHENDGKSDDERRTWKIPILLKDLQGIRYYYWVGFKFSRPLPSLGAWPSEADWPRLQQ